MSEINVGASWQQHLYETNDKDTEKTKKAQKVKFHATDTVQSSDALSKTEGAEVEEYIAPPDRVKLEQADHHASNTPPGPTKPSPGATFEKTLNELISNMSEHEFSQFNTLQGMPKDKVASMVKFAYTHPEADVDQNVRYLANRLTDDAALQTAMKYGLRADWKPPAPSTAKADAAIAKNYNANFEQTVRQELVKEGYQGPELEQAVKELTFAHYHPDDAPGLSSEKAAILSNAEGESLQLTREQNGLPEDYEVETNSESFDAKVAVDYDQNFERELNNYAEASGMSDADKAQLETMHYFPEADVPHKEQLAGTLSDLQQKALGQAQDEFNLPESFKPETASSLRKTVIEGEYSRAFTQNVKGVKPPLTLAQQQLLIATGGLSASNLPPELKALFEDLKNQTVDQIQERFGLPKSWGPKNGKLEGLPLPEGAEETEETEESGEAEGAEETTDIYGSGQTGDTSGIQQGRTTATRGVKSQSGALNLETDYNYKARDLALGHQVLDHYTETADVVGKLANEFLAPDDAVLIKDFMLAVSKGLSTLRFGLYAVQVADTKASTKLSQMNKESNIQKAQEQQKQIEKQREGQKACAWLLDVFAIVLTAIPIVGQMLTPFTMTMLSMDAMKATGVKLSGPVGDLQDLIQKTTQDIVKTATWALDIVLGGLLSMLFSLMKVQFPGENPFVIMGVMKKEDAQWMDLALQITVMIVEMIVSAIFTGGASMAAFITMLSAKVATQTTLQAIKTVIVEVTKAVVQAVIEALRSAAQEAMNALRSLKTTLLEAGGQIARGEATTVARNVGQAVADTASDVAQSVKTTLRETKDSISEGLQSIKQTAADAKDSLVSKFQGANKGSEAGETSRIANTSDSTKLSKTKESSNVTDASRVDDTTQLNDVSRTTNVTQGKEDELTRELDKYLEGLSETEKKAKKAQIRTLQQQMTDMAKIFDMYMLIKDLMSGTLGVANGIVNMVNEIKLAEAAEEKAEVAAKIIELDMSIKITDKVKQGLLDGLQQDAKWIAQINKQQAGFWQKAHIDYQC